MNLADEKCIRPAKGLKSVVKTKDNPLDVFMRLSVAEHYDQERVSLTELHMSIPGHWCHHDVSLTWDAEKEQIQLYLVFDGRTPGGRTDDMCRLMSLINERLSVGHFDYWEKNGTLVYRNAISLRGGARLKVEQAQDMIALALDAAERGYPACQYVVWAGKSPEDALTSALVDLAAHP
jgi:hypothetical protein